MGEEGVGFEEGSKAIGFSGVFLSSAATRTTLGAREMERRQFPTNAGVGPTSPVRGTPCEEILIAHHGLSGRHSMLSSQADIDYLPPSISASTALTSRRPSEECPCPA